MIPIRSSNFSLLVAMATGKLENKLFTNGPREMHNYQLIKTINYKYKYNLLNNNHVAMGHKQILIIHFTRFC